MLRYKIKIRAGSEEENPRKCFLEEINLENFEARLHTMIADINDIDDIMQATRNGDEIHISTALDEITLKDKFKHLFIREYCYIRFVDMQKLSE